MPRVLCVYGFYVYFNVCSSCYATIARRNKRCFVTAGKHDTNTRATARQLLGKRVPAATDTHATVDVFLVYDNGNGGSWGTFIIRVSPVPETEICQQFSWVKWRKQLVCEWVQMKVRLWREDQEVGVKWPPSWDPVSWVVNWQEYCTGGFQSIPRL
jgi:hypothetical protein